MQYPNKNAIIAMMKAARNKKLDNAFFINKNTGEIVTTAFKGKDSYFQFLPQNTYEIDIKRKAFMSYEELNNIIQLQIEMISQ